MSSSAPQVIEFRPGPKRWFFDAWSRVYDASIVQLATYRPVQDAVIEVLGYGRHSRVLDVGCGTGLLACRIHEVFPQARVVGCDFSGGMLSHARARGPSLPWVQGDGGRLPFADRAFDTIVSTEAFHWFPDQTAALAEFFRVLAPGGRLLVALMNTPAAPLSALLHFGSKLVGEPFYWPSIREMGEWVEAAGFRIERRQRVYRLPGLLLPPVLTCAVRPSTGAAVPRHRGHPHRGQPRRRSSARTPMHHARRPRRMAQRFVGPVSAPSRVRSDRTKAPMRASQRLIDGWVRTRPTRGRRDPEGRRRYRDGRSSRR
jgi:ubiquinone/menaquinone biosynthesis C-methylase UbiE